MVTDQRAARVGKRRCDPISMIPMRLEAVQSGCWCNGCPSQPQSAPTRDSVDNPQSDHCQHSAATARRIRHTGRHGSNAVQPLTHTDSCRQRSVSHDTPPPSSHRHNSSSSLPASIYLQLQLPPHRRSPASAASILAMESRRYLQVTKEVELEQAELDAVVPAFPAAADIEGDNGGRCGRCGRRFLEVLLNLLMLVGVCSGLFSLVQGVSRYSDPCSQPLPCWLLIQAALTLLQTVAGLLMHHSRSSYKAQTLQADGLLSAQAPLLARLHPYVSSVFVGLSLSLLGWLLVGSYWCWSVSAESCTAVVYNSTKSSLIISYVIVAVIIAVLVVKSLRRARSSTQGEVKAAGLPGSEIDEHEAEGQHRQRQYRKQGSVSSSIQNYDADLGLAV